MEQCGLWQCSLHGLVYCTKIVPGVTPIFADYAPYDGYLGIVICIQWKTWKEVKIQGKYGDSSRYIKAERKIKQIGDLSIMFYRSKRNEQIRKVRKFIGIQKENMPMNPDHGGGQAEWPVQRHTCCESILTLKMMTGSSSTELLYRIKRNYSHKSQQVIVI